MQRSKSERSLNLSEEERLVLEEKFKDKYSSFLSHDSFNDQSLTPIPRGPISAIGQMKAFLANQMEKTSQAKFDESVELR